MTKYFKKRFGSFEIYEFNEESNEYELQKKLSYLNVVKEGIRRVMDLSYNEVVKEKPE